MIFVVGYYYLASGFIYHLSSSGSYGGAANRINVIIINVIITNNTIVDDVSIVVSFVGVGEGHAHAAPTKEQHINIFKTNVGHIIHNEQRASLLVE